VDLLDSEISVSIKRALTGFYRIVQLLLVVVGMLRVLMQIIQ